MDVALHRELELHEAEVWARCFEAVAAVDDNALGATVDRTSVPPLAVLDGVDSDQINRVVGLGLDQPATRESVERTVEFYRSRGRTRFRIELSPAASPPELGAWLRECGLPPREETSTKMWRATEDLPRPLGGVDVRELGAVHRDMVGELNVRAWGAWDGGDALRSWFGCTVGWPGFHHYGVFDGGQLVSVGAVAAIGDLAWLGFAASHPRYRGQGLRRRINEIRLAEARRMGCRIAHVELETRYAGSPKLPFTKLSQRVHHAPA